MFIGFLVKYLDYYYVFLCLQELEIQGGTAALRTLARIPLEGPAAEEGQGKGEEARVQYIWA